METFLTDKYKQIKWITTRSVRETINFAAEFASLLKNQNVVGLTGNLGAGKTQFVKGMASKFKAKKSEVTSPTFCIVKQYKGRAMRVNHFDFYRINSIRDLETIGFREYLTAKHTLTVIEWADKLKDFCDYDFVVDIEQKGENTRKITVYERQC